MTTTDEEENKKSRRKAHKTNVTHPFDEVRRAVKVERSKMHAFSSKHNET